jgi:myo-inositol-1(or 4)-monophosphatase
MWPFFVRRPILAEMGGQRMGKRGWVSAWLAAGLSFGGALPAGGASVPGPAGCQELEGRKVFSRPVAETAERLMREAGARILRLRDAGDFQLQQKSSFADLKTRGDCASQDHIFLSLARQHPKHRFLGEEKCAASKAAGDPHGAWTWILDPIDGTTNYAHGMPHFSISLALVAGGQVCFGAVYAPVYDELFFAQRGKGAFLSRKGGAPKPIHVSRIEKLNSSLWITGTEGGPAEKAIAKNVRTFAIAREIVRQSHDMRRTGSAALDLASVASGRAEGYWELGEGLNWWDISAGLLLVTEAGGQVDVVEPRAATQSGAEVDLERPILAVIATNGQAEIRDAIVPRVNEALKP